MSIEYKDYYAALGVKKEASAEQIKQAYRRLAKMHHPDLNPDKDKASAEERFKEINEAYEVLSDPQKKGKYDQIGSDWNAGREPASPPGKGEARHGFRTGGQGASFAGFSDFFETVFGDIGGQDFGGHASFKRDSGKGQDAQAEFPLSLEDSLRGGEKRISIAAPVLCLGCRGAGRKGNHFCPACAGVGETRQERSITANLPKPIRDGMRLRLRGQGGLSSRGGKRGDLFLRIRLLPHPTYKVSGSDLETTITAMPWDAFLGGEISVPTLEGPIRIRIPAGTHSGSRLRVAGKGLGKNGDSRGDLYAVVRIDIPSRSNDRMEQLYRDMREAGT